MYSTENYFILSFITFPFYYDFKMCESELNFKSSQAYLKNLLMVFIEAYRCEFLTKMVRCTYLFVVLNGFKHEQLIA